MSALGVASVVLLVIRAETGTEREMVITEQVVICGAGLDTWLVLARILNIFDIRPRQTGVRGKSRE